MTTFELCLLSICGLNALVSLIFSFVSIKKKIILKKLTNEQKELKELERLKDKYEKK